MERRREQERGLMRRSERKMRGEQRRRGGDGQEER